MAKVIISGKEYPVSVTFAAIASYLEASGRNNVEGLAEFQSLPPTEYPALVAACINEGLRCQGSDERLSAEDIAGAPGSFLDVSCAVAAIFREMVPQTSAPAKKKA